MLFKGIALTAPRLLFLFIGMAYAEKKHTQPAGKIFREVEESHVHSRHQRPLS
ncbi:MAG: hypothetical protein LIP28_04740 [Deltaproteobacteria bacterium]|nr:hypothetical protein [Deltaproteobacteria bacterium]